MKDNSDDQSRMDRLERRLDDAIARLQQLEAINQERAEKERKLSQPFTATAPTDGERERIWQDKIQPRFQNLGKFLEGS